MVSLSIFLFLVCLAVAIYLQVHLRKLGDLDLEPEQLDFKAPKLSIVVAAKDEEEKIEKALLSLTQIDYPNIEIIVVDDRSEDDTFVLAQNVSRIRPTVRVISIKELPAGWLGKTNALHQGFLQATGEWVLFTDADVIFKPSAINRALAYAVLNRVDHLALLVTIWSRDSFLDGFFNFFAIYFFLFAKPWNAARKQSKDFIGIGAFNLIRRSALEQIGGLEAVRLRPDDDIKLGKVLKRAGLTQHCLKTRLISVEWYKDFAQCLQGLEKNFFSGLEYNVAKAVASCLWILLLYSFPIFLAFAPGPHQEWALATYLVQCYTYWRTAKVMGKDFSFFLLTPVYGVIFAWIILRTLSTNLRDRGIYWRGTFYSLELLKTNRV